ncbi:MAG: hypothetical protein IKH69_05500 [Bacteroidaceae bacterium]|nr:hypothetical protein [Bacteroidaceae bacterium]
MKKIGILALAALCVMPMKAQWNIRLEAQGGAASGDHTPLWLNANRYGMGSTETANGYVRAGVFKPVENDAREWKLGAGVDVAVAAGYTSTLIVQQAYGELQWKLGRLTVGSKEQPMQLKNQELSSGSQTLGINARPVPGVRLELSDYWDIPGLNGWLGLKGHIFYGLQTDDAWQKDFTQKQHKYTEHTRLHTKAGYLRIGRSDRPLTVELGLEMAAQYGGKSVFTDRVIENRGGLTGMWHAFIPSGGEVTEEAEYRNAEGNHLGSWVARVNLDYDDWGIAVYGDHYFEDHSAMFMVDYDGYGTGSAWNKKEKSRYFGYDLKDIMLGAELTLKQTPWLQSIVLEYLYTKYQSGPTYNDHSPVKSTHISGMDNYYNHGLFTGWQHWGMVMGNPLYRSPLYNTDGQVNVENNRFWAWHLGLSGSPTQQLHYRLLGTLQKGWGTYGRPLPNPLRNVSLMGEVTYYLPKPTSFGRLSVTGAVGMDHGGLLGNNVGALISLRTLF